MIARQLAYLGLWALLLAGFLAMPAGLILSAEDGPIPADQLIRKKARARAVLIGGGVVAAVAAVGLHVQHRTEPRRP